MALTEQRIDVYPYEDLSFDFTASPVVDVNGWLVTFSVRTLAGVLVFSKTVGDGITLPAPTANGVIRVTLLSALTGTLSVQEYRFDLVRTSPGAVKELAIGVLNVLKQYRV